MAFGEALQPEFKTYARAVVENAKALAAKLKERGADLVAGGTDTHLALVDLRPLGLTGKDADEALERSGITCNKNGVPFDPLPPVKTSGIRVGSPAGTTRGFGVQEFREIGDMIADVLDEFDLRDVFIKGTPRPDFLRMTIDADDSERCGTVVKGPDPDVHCSTEDPTGADFLTSGVVTIPPDGIAPKMRFEHYVATEQGFDGGNVQLSVN